MKTFLFLALVGFAAAECPNACSGHGTCGAKDACACYQNYQGNDCSERTCYFGIAHVDSPKGDLNADGFVSGPLTTVVTGSEVYPWGTTEQFPNTDANEGHFYMECSNKGICDRKSGECDCFDGYTGTACARAACPNDCSGHGTCESIKELAEMRSYDTNEHDVATTRVAGTDNHHGYDSSIEESYSYNLWDQDKTMGCKCDPVYYGADCSLKKCKYGVDPLFYDHEGVIRQTTVVHVGSSGKDKANLGGSFKIVFYDVFGEKYVTKTINARGATAEDVKLALQALPNGVIAKNNQDVTAEQPNAVMVAAQKSEPTGTNAPEVDQAGGIGAGKEGSLAAGLGTQSDHGSEFTITFKTNPGVLKSIEIDTRGVNNPGRPDYWVANARQGQFASRYTNNLGRIQVLQYGSKHLYTNTDLSSTGSSQVAADTLVKVGGQEFRVISAASNKLILDEPYLGASIQPVTVDTGMFAKEDSFLKAAATAAVNDPTVSDRFLVVGDARTAAVADSFDIGKAIYVNECAMTVNNYAAALGSDTLPTGGKLAAGEYLDTTPSPAAPVGVAAAVDGGNDCTLSLLASAPTGGFPVQRRSDDTANQNLYSTSGDTAVAAATDTGLSFQRGSAVGAITKGGNSVDEVPTPPAPTPASPAYSTIVKETTETSGVGQDDLFFFHSHGPFVLSGTPANAKELTFTGIDAQHDIVGLMGNQAAGAKIHLTTSFGASDTNIDATKALLIGGRRYRVKSSTAAGLTLSETFAGGQLRQVCDSCVTEQSTNDLALSVNTAITGLPVGSLVGLSANLNLDNFAMVTTAVTEAATGQTIAVGNVCNSGGNGAPFVGGTNDAANNKNTFAAGQNDLYTIQGFSSAGYSYSVITESASATTYQYVAQCSNRGSCDASTGLCKCFKGYSNDNCDTQNMLAA